MYHVYDTYIIIKSHNYIIPLYHVYDTYNLVGDNYLYHVYDTYNLVR